MPGLDTVSRLPRDRMRVLSLLIERALITKIASNQSIGLVTVEEVISALSEMLSVLNPEQIQEILDSRNKLSVQGVMAHQLPAELLRLMVEVSLALDENLRTAVEVLIFHNTLDKTAFERKALQHCVSSAFLSDAPLGMAFDEMALINIGANEPLVETEMSSFYYILEVWKQTSSFYKKGIREACLAENREAFGSLGRFFLETLFLRTSLEHVRLQAILHDKTFMPGFLNTAADTTALNTPAVRGSDVQRIRVETNDKVRKLKHIYATKFANINVQDTEAEILRLSSRLCFLRDKYAILTQYKILLAEKTASFSDIESLLSHPKSLEHLLDALLEIAEQAEIPDAQPRVAVVAPAVTLPVPAPVVSTAPVVVTAVPVC